MPDRRFVLIGSALLLLAGLAYWPGLSGGFLFDDFDNLAPLGALGGVRSLDTLYAWLGGGFAGPTGRPISLLSFLLDAQNWPADPAAFKRTNLIVHGLCASLIALCSLFLLRALGRKPAEASALALLGAGLWLLHPFFASTTLYVVQRMTQLSALFALAGLAGYLHGRGLLEARPRRAYVWMSASLVAGTLLASLSKENGALLPLLILIVEWVLAGTRPKPRPEARWRAIFLVLPSLAIGAYLVTTINFSPDAWPERPFTQPQRLLSEARIVWDYLGGLFFPRVEGFGFFQDAIPVSTGLLTPPVTLPALLGIIALALAGLFLRRRAPLFSLALLFFLAGHLLESSFIGLELYFEHRNYLPAAFIFLPLADAVFRLRRRFGRVLPGVLSLALCGGLAFLLHQRALLWADTDQLQIYWALNQPESPRAQNALARYLLQQGRGGEAVAHLDAAMARLPKSGLLKVAFLYTRMELRQATAEDFERIAEALRTTPLDGQTIHGLIVLVEQARTPPVDPVYLHGISALLDALETHPQLPEDQHTYLFLQRGQLALSAQEDDVALRQLTRAMEMTERPGVALNILAELASHEHYQAALDLVPAARAVLERYPDRRHATYLDELQRMEKNLREALQKP